MELKEMKESRTIRVYWEKYKFISKKLREFLNSVHYWLNG